MECKLFFAWAVAQTLVAILFRFLKLWDLTLTKLTKFAYLVKFDREVDTTPVELLRLYSEEFCNPLRVFLNHVKRSCYALLETLIIRIFNVEDYFLTFNEFCEFDVRAAVQQPVSAISFIRSIQHRQNGCQEMSLFEISSCFLLDYNSEFFLEWYPLKCQILRISRLLQDL